MGHWKSTFHKLVRDLLKVNIYCAIWSTWVFISSFCKRYHQRSLFVDMIMEGFFLPLQNVSNIAIFHQDEALPHFINQSRGSISSYGSDTARKVTCFGNSGLKISQVPHHVTSCKDVLRTSVFIPLLPCSLEGIPFQLWTVICYKGPEWNGLQECVPRDKKGICWAFVRL